MSLLDKASLIVTPNAYKESKLYSVVPNTTLGDMDVVRATTATRVNSAGLIEVVPRNLFTYSQQIDTADWVRQGVSATANQAISPNGTLTAELLDDGTAASTQHWIFQNPSLLNSTTYTISFYAKYISRKFMAVNIFNGLASQYVYYNIQDGLISGSTGDVTASITSVGNGWFRIVYTRPMATSGTAPNFRIAFADDTSNITYTGSNKQAYVWGFQLENFPTATEYFPTTTRLNIPRIDYTNGSCPSILVEPQRTNLVFPSATLTTQTRTVTAAANTLSFYGTGTIVLSGVHIATLTGTGANNRVSLTFTPTAGSLILTVTGTVTNAQLELGSYATSYVPTVASTVTRNADVISKTGISSLIGQTEGTIYAEIKVNKLIGTASRYIFHISDGTANNRIYMAFSGASSNVLRGRIFNGGTLQCSIDTSTITTTGTYKLALAYKNNDIVFYVNGVQIGVDTSATIPTCSKVDIGHNYAGASQLGDGITNTNIFKTRLTNTELQSLTTL